MDKVLVKQKVLLSNYFVIKFLEIVKVSDMTMSLRVVHFLDRLIQAGRVKIKSTIFVFAFKKVLGLLLQSFGLSMAFKCKKGSLHSAPGRSKRACANGSI